MVNSRAKGKNYELKICKILHTITGLKFTTTPGSGAVATKTGQVLLAGDIMGVNHKFPWIVECKKYKDITLADLILQKGNLVKWLAQMERESIGRPGMLIFSKNYGKNMILIETALEFKNVFKFNQYTIGIFENIMPVIWDEHKKSKILKSKTQSHK